MKKIFLFIIAFIKRCEIVMKFKRILIIFIVGFCLLGLFGCKNATITYKDPYYAEPKELTIKETSDPEEVKESLYAIVLSNNPVKDVTEESLDIEFKTNLAFKDEEGVEQKVAIKGTIETDLMFTKPEYIISTSDIISGYSGSGKLTFSGSVPNSSGKIESFSKSTIAFYVESGMLYATFDLDKTFVNFIKKENVCDLHTDNIGFRYDGSPVILDYSSYFEN